MVLLDPLVPVARCGQRVEDFANMLLAAGFHGKVDRSVAKVHTVIGSIVLGLYDVRAQISDDLGQLVQRAGTVGQMDP